LASQRFVRVSQQTLISGSQIAGASTPQFPAKRLWDRIKTLMGPKPNLDFLRAIAIILVILDHTLLLAGHPVVRGFSFLWLGVFGVYLFFVHTCLVLMWSLERRPHTLDFYIRRIFRIYPLAVVVILAILLFRIPLSAGGRMHWTPSVLASNLLLVQNLWRRPLAEGVLWSLPLELEMYLVLPALFAFAYRERTRWTLIVLWGVACLAARTYSSPPLGNGLFTVIPHFLPGVIAYVGFMRTRGRWPAWGFGLLLAALIFWFERAPGVERGWAVCLVLGLALPYFRQIGSRWLSAASHLLAKYSYSIYLIHLICLAVAFHTFPQAPLALKLSLALVSTAGLSFGAYHLIEHPMILLGAKVAGRFEQKLDLAEHRDPKLT
jgi:peptidoglycan/LPS O-acetylase OafA/YrhL